MNDKTRSIMRILAGIIMGLFGITLAFLSYNLTGLIGILGQSIGFSFIVTGTVTVFQESVLTPLRKEETKEQIDRISKETKQNIDRISRETKDGFDRVFQLLRGPGIYMLSPERRGNLRYYKWLLERASQQIFFAGHSVLHRIEADFKSQGLVSVSEALKQKLSEGSKIRIIFLDPTWIFLDKIAQDEKQEPIELLTDLAKSLGLCKKLWQLIEADYIGGEIEIRTCQELKQFAYHRVCCMEKNEDEVLVGFYFAGKLGEKTPLFVVENEQIRDIFLEHFTTVSIRSKRLLIYSRTERSFDHKYYRECLNSLHKYIDDKTLSDLCP